jgi:hypothetical protein
VWQWNADGTQQWLPIWWHITDEPIGASGDSDGARGARSDGDAIAHRDPSTHGYATTHGDDTTATAAYLADILAITAGSGSIVWYVYRDTDDH